MALNFNGKGENKNRRQFEIIREIVQKKKKSLEKEHAH